jgi:hypothetical protein
VPTSALPYREQLQALYNKGGGWHEFFEMLSTYTRRRTELNADKAAEHSGLALETVVGFLKELDNIGIGKFVLGRRGFKTRLIWNCSPRSVGDVARGRATELESYEGPEETELAEGVREPGPRGDLQTEFAILIAEAKRDLAAKMGISPTQISITINM